MNKEVNILGAGEVYQKKIKPALKYLGIEHFKIFDPNYTNLSQNETRINSIDELSSNSITFILSPNKFHLTQSIELIKKQVAVYIEKPFVVNKQELEIFEKTGINSPVYLGDYYIFKALGLLSLVGIKMPFKKFIEIKLDKDEKLLRSIHSNKQILGEINKIEGCLLEGGNLGTIQHRNWLSEKGQGGMLLDLMIHLTNIVFMAGFKISEINNSILYESAEKIGDYKILSEDKVEDLAKVSGIMNNDIEFNFTAGKNAVFSDRWLKFTDKNGYSLELVFNSNNEVFYRYKDEILGKLLVKLDPYILTMMDAFSFFREEKNFVKYFDIQKNSICAIEDFKDSCR